MQFNSEIDNKPTQIARNLGRTNSLFEIQSQGTLNVAFEVIERKLFT